jgi:D-alanyl-D-alanine carboxypeptidase (penicillin-binding protein 5/6)
MSAAELFGGGTAVRTLEIQRIFGIPDVFRTGHSSSDGTRPGRAARGLLHGLLLGLVLAVAVCLFAIPYTQAANNSVQGGAKKEVGGFDTDAPFAILIEAESGSVLFEKDADALSAPSSMMKLMTAEVVFEALKNGRIKLTDEYRVSENSWRKGGAPSGGSTMFAALNSQVSVADLLRGLAVQSANDACMILAEGIAGGEAPFAEMMTKRARELGLTRSTFGNSSGLPDPNNRMTVRELAMLARHIIADHPDFYPLFSEREFTWNKIRQQNRNPLLALVPGADGFKTGYTKEGGYGMVATVLQDGLRLIAVVNGLEDAKDRLTETRKLLDWGFKNFEVRPLFAAGQTVGHAKVFGGESGSVALKSDGPVRIMTHRSGNDRLIARIIYTGPVRAPVKAGQPIGTVKVWRGETLAVEAPLFAAEAVTEGTMTRKAVDTASELAIGFLRAGLDKVLSKEPKTAQP